jgi:Secretion system C-terminal sorting domain
VYVGNGNFWRSTIGSNFTYCNVNGTYSAAFGALPDDMRGLALFTCHRDVTGDTAVICAGASTTLHRYIGDTISGGFQWTLNGNIIPGATDSIYVADSAGVYNCLATDLCGYGGSPVGFTLVVSPQPVVTLSTSSPIQFCAGDSSLLSSASNTTMQWYLNGAAILGATDSSYSAQSSGVYNLLATSAFGCSDSATVGISINVLPLPTIVISASSPLSFECEGTSDTLVVSGANTYTWSSTETNDTIIVVHSTGNTTWTAVGTALNGCVDSLTYTITGVYANNVAVDLSTMDSMCVNNSLAALSTATPAGGTWSGTGVSGSDFDPAVAGVGTHVISYSAISGTCTYSSNDTIEVLACVGIKEALGNNAKTIVVMPNPNAGNFTLQASIDGVYTIVNELGQVVKTMSLNNTNSRKVSIQDLNSGVYFVIGVNNTSRTKLVVTE